jgi:hypothetical protein
VGHLDEEASDEALAEVAKFADKRLDLYAVAPSAVSNDAPPRDRFRNWVGVYPLALE